MPHREGGKTIHPPAMKGTSLPTSAMLRRYDGTPTGSLKPQFGLVAVSRGCR